MKQLFLYLTGQVQFAPTWFYKLPKCVIPTYQGDKSYRWFGIHFTFEHFKDYEVCEAWGDTLFMAWRRKLISRETDEKTAGENSSSDLA